MRFDRFLVFLTALAASARASEVKFVRVWPGYRSAESFVRISEYFTGRENTGGWTILRTKPDDRAGFYFLARVRNSSGAKITGAVFELSVTAPGARAPRTFTFPAEIPKGSRVFEIGLSGSDWPNRKDWPVAWHLALRAPGGTELAQARSFLSGRIREGEILP